MTYLPRQLDRLRLRHMRLLELIGEHRSLRAVGHVLNLTQPAVSQMVKDLEYAFGVTLVERSVRGVTLSPAGERALQRVRSGLAAFDHLASELRAGLPPVVRIGTNPAVMFELLPAALRLLDADEANMRFAVRAGLAGDMMHALWEGELDCYVGRVDWDQLPPHMTALLRHDPLGSTELVLACSRAHPLATRSNLSARDLTEYRWALPPADSSNRLALETGLRNLGLPGPKPVVEIAADPNALISLARQMGLLICIARLALDTHPAAEELCVLDLPDLGLPPVQIGFVTLAEYEGMDAVKALRHALAETARQDVRGTRIR